MSEVERLVRLISTSRKIPAIIKVSRDQWLSAHDELTKRLRDEKRGWWPLSADIGQANFLLCGVPIICDCGPLRIDG